MGQTQELTSAQLDRAAGVLLAMACGDALGAPYEFRPPMAADAPVAMIGGGPFNWEPAEWTDDTSMAVPLLVAAETAQRTGSSFLDQLDSIAVAWSDWARQAKDVGVQTSSVLRAAASFGSITAESVAGAAAAHHERTGRSGGNGSLMRTAPVALAFLNDEPGLAAAARTVSDLTHPDPDAGDACVLWCAAIRHAVLHAELDIRVGLGLLPDDRHDRWNSLISEAESSHPSTFTNNGWVVQALQAAWSSIHLTAQPELDVAADSYPAQHLRLSLETAVRSGNDTDTVAAIAGGLLGARWGASAVPAQWRRKVHGWPGITGADLANRGLAVASGNSVVEQWPLHPGMDYAGWNPRGRLVEHPHDPGVLLGDVAVLDDLQSHVTAVVSLCRVGTDQPAGFDSDRQLVVWLIDSDKPSSNPNLEYVIADAADAIAAYRAEGHTVLLHCVQAQSRTPTVGAVYAIRHRGVDPTIALDEVVAALPDADPIDTFRQVTPKYVSVTR